MFWSTILHTLWSARSEDLGLNRQTDDQKEEEGGKKVPDRDLKIRKGARIKGQYC